MKVARSIRSLPSFATHHFQSCSACSTSASSTVTNPRRGVVSVKGLTSHCYVGMYEAERTHGQKFECDVSVILTPEATERTIQSDLLCDTVDFDSVAMITDRVLSDRENPPRLIETLTRRLLKELSCQFSLLSPMLVDRIDVHIRKPQAPAALMFDSFGVGASVDGFDRLIPGSAYVSVDGLIAHSYIGDIPLEFELGRKVGLSYFRAFYRDSGILDSCQDDCNEVFNYVDLANALNDFLTFPKLMDTDISTEGGIHQKQTKPMMHHCEMFEAAHSAIESMCLQKFSNHIDRCEFEIVKFHPAFPAHCSHVSYSVR